MNTIDNNNELFVSLVIGATAIEGMKAIKEKYNADKAELKALFMPKGTKKADARKEADKAIKEAKEDIIKAMIDQNPELAELTKNKKTTKANHAFSLRKTRILNDVFGKVITTTDKKKADEAKAKKEKEAQDKANAEHAEKEAVKDAIIANYPLAVELADTFEEMIRSLSAELDAPDVEVWTAIQIALNRKYAKDAE